MAGSNEKGLTLNMVLVIVEHCGKLRRNVVAANPAAGLFIATRLGSFGGGTGNENQSYQ